MTKVVAIGDVGLPGGFHVGDEAMLEAAIEQLRARGVTDWTIVSGHPESTAARYGVPAVPRFGFGAAAQELAEEIDRAIARPATLLDDTAIRRIHDALSGADAVLVSGGGNLTAQWPQHVYERVFLARMARSLGLPVLITGQTVGPTITEDLGKLLAELMREAAYVSVRESESLALVTSLGRESGRTSLTVDDAAFLGGRGDREWLDSLSLVPRGFVAATFHPYSGVSDPATLVDGYAELLDAVVAATGCAVVLVPHVVDEATGGDLTVHDELARRCERVHSLPMMGSREAVWWASQAGLVLSSRYHPVVFALAAGVPVVGIGVDSYTHQKIAGALAHAGMADWCVSVLSGPQLAADAVAEAWRRRTELAEHLTSVAQRAEVQLAQHWDDMAAALTGQAPMAGRQLQPAPVLAPTDSWCAQDHQVRRWARALSDRHTQLQLDDLQRSAHLERMAADLARAQVEIVEVTQRCAELEAALELEAGAADTCRQLVSDVSRRLSDVSARLAQSAQVADHATTEIVALQQTRLFRWSAHPRAAYAAARRGARRRLKPR